mgnify:CR=1 FL=1
MITASGIESLNGVGHAFFTRDGGVSEGHFASLNCGFGSGDERTRVTENRRRAMRSLGRTDGDLVTVHQVHSATAVGVERPWAPGEAPVADAMATRTPGIALGVLSADCAPVLLADAIAGVIGAAHGGWRGLRAGVLEATLQTMIGLGAEVGAIAAAVGPCIQRDSYEVGPEFHAEFLADDSGNGDFFVADAPSGRFRFDLAGYAVRRLKDAGCGTVQCVEGDTFADEARFFSYRRNARQGISDYGRNLSAIVLGG